MQALQLAPTLKLIVCALLVLAGIAVLMTPALHYIVVGWKAKRKDIMDGLDKEARLAYFQMFSRSDPTPPDAGQAASQFEKLYSKWYGRRLFFVPALLLLLVGSSAVASVVLSGLARLGYVINPLYNVPDTAMAAIAGAYLWVVNDFTSRARRLDFSPADIHWAVLRLVIAVPMGYAFAAMAAKAVGPFVGFALGAFPLATLTSMLQRLADKSLGIGATEEESADNIIKLQGVNREIVERLANEDVTTVTQVAYCDPVRLVMRAHLSFNFVTDCMNQALAWLYLPADLDTIRPLGMRGAVEIKHLIEAYDDAASADHARAIAAFPKIAAAIKQDPDTLQVTFREIAGDPYTIFLDRVWT